MEPLHRGLTIASSVLLLASVGQAQIHGPALGNNRITQDQITSGSLTLDEIRRKGLEIFTTPFNKLDGHGDGAVNPLDPVTPGGRPTTNGTWLRVNGLDSQTCLECHSILSNATIPATLGLAGVGGIAASAFPGVSFFDLADGDFDGTANVNGRLINPPFLFGAGGVELLSKEMTMDLQALKASAQANPDVPVVLESKGVSFGSIVFDSSTQTFDTSNVVGVDSDLVVKPFGRKGDNTTVREFDLNALQFHMGMQPVEVVGQGVDADGDGVVDEALVGELSALHVFATTLERPETHGSRKPAAIQGAKVFRDAGCVACHVPVLETESERLPLAFPEVHTDPTQNVYLEVDLTDSPGFRSNRKGGVVVPLFSDLKRHDMGPALAETTGHPLDPFFITPRLWGVSDTAPYLHDGRALTISEAIQMHGGEGAQAAANFAALSQDDRRHLLAYLGTLRVPSNPAKGIDQPVRQ